MTALFEQASALVRSAHQGALAAKQVADELNQLTLKRLLMRQSELKTEIAELQERIAELEPALRFYGDPRQWSGDGQLLLAADQGKIARDVLDEEPHDRSNYVLVTREFHALAMSLADVQTKKGANK